MFIWIYAFLSVLFVSSLSLIGLLTLTLRKQTLNNALLYLVSFSTGALFGDAFLHLLPEAVKKSGFGINISLFILGGIILFFIIEKFICWRHCHVPTSNNHPHPVAFMNLFGDAVHNFIDGLIIGGSYLVSIPLGVATTVAIILHEIPQEIGDFGILLYGGFSVRKALLFNFIISLTSFLGMFISLLLGNILTGFTLLITPLAAGGFIYIAGSDLIPELHKERSPQKSFFQFIYLVAGILIMFLLLFLD